ncbi:T9SS type A sorting domain-containing protein [uncultured Winogradskyella sp.]|uniref:beta strand repeat-containing protein n=1 Tax=uncultured Winogradskyella sp. TaxID=395353 RepID=UPI00262F8268|nr:T9SS type A sorting domain-containing protein [uncultured Winogradskyella sp.]
MKHRVTLIAVITAIFHSTFSFAQLVTSGADDGTDGTLRNEIADTPPGGTITFAPAVLTVTLNSELVLDKDLIINGTVGTTVIIDANNNGRVFNVTSGDVTLNDLTITNGLAFDGGGIYMTNAMVTINNSIITGNTANGIGSPSGSGGGIYNDVGGVLVVNNSEISNNTANRAGGGVEDKTAGGATITTTLNNVNLINNNAGISPATAAPGNGGGIHVSSNGSVNIIGGSATGNIAALEGGALWNGFGTMTVDGVTINGNTASGDAADDGGGGIFNNGGTLIVQNGTTITNNIADGTAGSGGGIQNVDGGSVSVSDSTITGNTSNRAGGGIEDNSTNGVGTVTLMNVTLDNNTTGSAPGNGGGFHITGPGNATVIGGTINGNIAALEGGGLWNGSGTMTVDGVTINGNTASGDAADDGGGGIFNNGGTLIVQNGTTITNNIADGTAGSGGGLLSIDGDVTVTNSSLESNSANRAGGAIELIDGNLIFTNSSMINNDVDGIAGTAAPGNGGGFHVTGTSGLITISSSTISGNAAANEGGGLWNQNGTTMNVSMSIIDNNTAAFGGGIYNNGGSITNVITSTISSNSASVSGGGATNNGASLDFNAVTVAMNSSAGNGGGIDAVNSVSLKNTIVALNTASSGIDVSGTLTSNDYNLIGMDDLGIFTSQANDIEGIDPLLGPLQNNGGTTLTHQLLDTSPAYNAGDPADTFVDQIGQPVFGLSRDIGAYESQVALSIEDFNEVSVLNIYPNPTKGQFNIVIDDAVSGEVNVQIVSVTGNIVKQFTIGNGTNQMDISAMASGIYIVNINTERGTSTHKLILD